MQVSQPYLSMRRPKQLKKCQTNLHWMLRFPERAKGRSKVGAPGQITFFQIARQQHMQDFNIFVVIIFETRDNHPPLVEKSVRLILHTISESWPSALIQIQIMAQNLLKTNLNGAKDDFLISWYTLLCSENGIPQLSELNSFQFSINSVEKGLSRLSRGMQVLTTSKIGDCS